MISHMHHTISILSLAALTLQQEQQTCQSPQTNATGIISFPGLTPPGVESNIWYLSTSFTDLRHQNNNSVEQDQRFYISVPASQNFTDPTTGIDGCAVYFGRRGEESKGDGDWSNSCQDVIENDCKTQVLERAYTLARSAVGRGVSDEPQCGDLLRAMSEDECEDDGEDTGTVFASSLPTNGTCLGSPVGGTSIPGDYHSDMVAGIGAGPDDFDEYEVYDEYIDQATPMLFVAWGTAEGSTYTDARLMCITPNMIVEGSRGDAILAKSVSLWSCVAVALFAAIFLT